MCILFPYAEGTSLSPGTDSNTCFVFIYPATVYRKFFKSLLEIKPTEDTIGIMLHYDQSKTGEPRMVFSFGFVTAAELGPDDEAVSLELLEDGVTPKAPVDAMDDGLLKLYVSGNAFLKVLGAKLDVDTEKVIPILWDREGNLMDPNA
jgi:hypothetical protein